MLENYKEQVGFTLIEVLIVLAIIGVVSTAIFNVQLTGLEAWKFNRNQVELQQRSRGVVALVSKQIRQAEDVEDYDKDWVKDELILRLTGVHRDDVDNNKYYYIRYMIYDEKLGYRTLRPNEHEAENDSIWEEDSFWPTDEDWGSDKSPLTSQVVAKEDYDSDEKVFEYKKDKRLVIINLKLKQGKRKYTITNKVHLRREE